MEKNMFDEIEKKFLELLDLMNEMSWDDYVKLFQLAEKNNFHILKTGFYSPIPTVSKLSEGLFLKKENMHLDWNEKLQIELLNELEKYLKEFQNLISEKKFILDNGVFANYDAVIYHNLIRHFNPNQIIEIGGGNSTILAYHASLKNHTTKISVIDPYLQQSFKNQFPTNIKLIEKRVQDIPISFFKNLNKNDILFIDSTHISKIGSDVNYLYLEILPELNPGVLIHIHDIFLPTTYPRDWLEKKLLFWNEQDLLHAFLIGNNNFEILFGTSYMCINHPELMRSFFDTKSQLKGGSFWLRHK